MRAEGIVGALFLWLFGAGRKKRLPVDRPFFGVGNKRWQKKGTPKIIQTKVVNLRHERKQQTKKSRPGYTRRFR